MEVYYKPCCQPNKGLPFKQTLHRPREKLDAAFRVPRRVGQRFVEARHYDGYGQRACPLQQRREPAVELKLRGSNR